MCGIFGVYGHPEAANLTYLGLHGLQHRGQESAGIASSDSRRLYTYRGMGLVVDTFDEATLSRLKGGAAVGHVRYSTAGESDISGAQPLAVRHARGQLAVVHNGNLVNAGSLRQELERGGSIFSSNVDSEVIVHLFARTSEHKIVDRITATLARLEGAFSLLFLTERKLIAARDPYGFRPLCMGRIAKGKRSQEGDEAHGWVFASETSAFDLIGAEYVRPVHPGEIVVVDRKGRRSYRRFASPTKRFCVFEHVYFARPDSLLGFDSVYESRRGLGRQLSREAPAEADLVIPVPDSGTTAALGYAEQSGLPFEMGLIRSHYVGRTFIEPQQSIRHFGVRLKLAPVRRLIEGRRVVVVDDSLVRGTTSRKIVGMIRGAGAAEVHMRISSPPLRHPCFYGIDIPTSSELIAHSRSVEEIRAHTGADSLAYLSLEGMLHALGGAPEQGGAGGAEARAEGPPSTPRQEAVRYCDACFSGKYPVPFEQPVKVKPLPVLQR
jgi:amidophosphoribosyltransferase